MFGMRKGEELKAPRHASAAATRDIFPTIYKSIIFRILILSIKKLYFYFLYILLILVSIPKEVKK